jgi:hypothetical protein
LRLLGKTVLISNFLRFHRLANYLSGYTTQPISLTLGATRLKEIFDESLYNREEGGLLGGLGQLFRNGGRLYVYPSLNFETGEILTAETLQVAPHLKGLYAYLLENRHIEGLRKFNPEYLKIRSRDVLDLIATGDSKWEQQVPAAVVEVIRREKLFGYK